MLKKLIERVSGKLSPGELREVLELATTDIMVNRIGFGRRTSPEQAVEIATICCTVLRR